MFDASSVPSAPPAPIIVWSSSIKRSTFPLFITSSKVLLILSSNSPLYFVPATMADKSIVTTLFPLIVSGTLPSTILSAIASTMAVFPTPGSPIIQGLFLVRLLSICMTLCTSTSLPMTGSSFPLLAYSVRSFEYWSRIGVPDLALLPVLLFAFLKFE